MNESKVLMALSCVLAGILIFSFRAVTTATPNAGTISVTTNSDEFGTGADCSLREAIQSANTDSDFWGCTRTGTPPYTIQLSGLTYTLSRAGTNEDDNETGDLDIKAPLIIQGVGAASTIIQAGASTDTGIDRVLHVPTSSFSATISSVTIRHGRLSVHGEGGGINRSGTGTLNIVDSIVTLNRTESTGFGGGGIANYDGTVNIQNSTISGNIATGSSGKNAGGIYNDKGIFNITDNSVIGGQQANEASFGAGIFNVQGGTVVIDNSTVSGNTASVNGGGILNSDSGSSVTIQNNSLIGGANGNTANYGGGIFNVQGATTRVDASTVSGNTAHNQGGGILNSDAGSTLNILNGSLIGGTQPNTAPDGGGILNRWGATANLSASTVSGNTGTTNGGGLLNTGQASTMTFENGSQIYGNTADNWGGGVYNENSTVTVDDSQFFGNSAGDGGGALHNGGGMGQLTIQNGSIIGADLPNTAEIGGGIYADTGSLTTVRSSSIMSNTADYGGGALVAGATLIMTNSTVSSNTANIEGSGIYNVDGGSATIDRSTISANSTGGNGGGVYSTWEALTTLVNSTVSGNNAYGDGGGIYTNYTTTVTLTHVTLTNNWADYDKDSSGDGGGLYRDDAGDPNTIVNLANTLSAGNHRGSDDSSPDCFGTLTSLGHNLIGDNSGCLGFTDGIKDDQVGTSASPIDPRLGFLAENGGPTWTHALDDSSPAIDAADNSICQAAPVNGVDQRGWERITTVSTTCDIGAYERLFSVFIPLVLK